MGNDFVALLSLLGGCCGALFLLALIMFIATEIIGYARASANMDLPLKRKGLAGTVRQAQKRYRERIQHRQRERNAQTLTDNPFADMRTFTPTEFEKFVGALFKRRGFVVEHTGKRNDGGVDLIVHKDGKRAIVQCKYYQENKRIGPDVVRDLRGALAREQAVAGYLVTTADFTQAAIHESRAVADMPIILINGQMLSQALPIPNRP
ncbi:MAG: restriction endonuclease [Anaerolineae bacterium]|nr:restriction endonuclease [Anaerolineae bacterium]